MAEPGFWDNQEQAQSLINDTNRMKEKSENFKQLEAKFDDAQTALELLKADPDPELSEELSEEMVSLSQSFHDYELSLLLSDKYDQHNALMEIHPGAGGTEAMDWADMLLRMYQRYAASHDLKFEIEDYEPGEEAGVKSVSIRIQGKNAFGLLKSENGVHRLVRISPFDSAKRRHTSFASVEVIPEIDQSIEVDINPDDLRIDVYRSSGAGGQHINKTSSAVRITHLPTGIVVSCQSERSQLQNRETAMRMLKSKLLDLKEKEHKEKIEDIQGEQKDIAWGSQIRSYVFCPYTMVKDHRTGYEVGNVEAVMDGEIDDFIENYLKYNIKNK